MSEVKKQHLIDPEICIRCHTCEATCPIEAITHNDDNVVVDAGICNFCMDCVPVCPTGSIDEWRVVQTHYTLDEQFGWTELPEQQEFEQDGESTDTSIEAFDNDIEALLADAHSGAGGRVVAPASASKPSINLFGVGKAASAVVQGNYRLTDEASDSDVRHLILDLGSQTFPYLEGQSVGVIAPGNDASGKPHLPRLYSISSPRDGERPNFNNLSLTVKRDADGICSNYLCDLDKGATVDLVGPYGSTFLMPTDQNARLLMVCTGTGSAPFRAFTMRRARTHDASKGDMRLVFGARTQAELPYFGPLKKVPEQLLKQHLVFSREQDVPKRYVQDELRDCADAIADLLGDANTVIYICGLRQMEEGVEQALTDIAANSGINWPDLKSAMREQGRYHVETY